MSSTILTADQAMTVRFYAERPGGEAGEIHVKSRYREYWIGYVPHWLTEPSAWNAFADPNALTLLTPTGEQVRVCGLIPVVTDTGQTVEQLLHAAQQLLDAVIAHDERQPYAVYHNSNPLATLYGLIPQDWFTNKALFQRVVDVYARLEEVFPLTSFIDDETDLIQCRAIYQFYGKGPQRSTSVGDVICSLVTNQTWMITAEGPREITSPPLHQGASPL